MGKLIDNLIFASLLSIGFYFFYHGVFANRILCGALALLSCFVCRSLLRKIAGHIGNIKYFRVRRFRRNSGGILMRIAAMDEGDARSLAERLIQSEYSTDCAVEIMQRHPSTDLNENDLFSLWRLHRQEEKLAVLATCKCPDACRAMADGLTQPRIILFDGDAAADLLSAHPDLCPQAEDAPPMRIRMRLRRLRALFLNRRNAPRCLLIAASMLGIYVLTRSIAYLICACALLALALLSMTRKYRPVKRI